MEDGGNVARLFPVSAASHPPTLLTPGVRADFPKMHPAAITMHHLRIAVRQSRKTSSL
jgi:hypothetical protein